METDAIIIIKVRKPLKNKQKNGVANIIGDSQLLAIDRSKMSRTHDVKVCSQGGLKLKRLDNLLRQEIKYNPDEVTAHVGVNNIEFKSEEDILDKFVNISDSFYDMTKLTFLGIIRRPDKLFLNQKVDSININPTGQKRLAMNFITQIKSSG